MHALTGWIEIKTPIEEGWRAAQRCRRAGKKLYLLSNYPREGYLRMREKFADLFEIFDGGGDLVLLPPAQAGTGDLQTLIDTCHLEPGRSLFIDDTLCNVQGAMNMGIHGFHMHEKGMMDRFFL